MKVYKTEVQKIPEQWRLVGRVNLNLFRHNREVDVCECDDVNTENLMYHTFGHLFDKTEGVVSRDLFGYLSDNIHEEKQLIQGYLRDRKTEMFDYLDTITSGEVRPDVLCFFYLCKMYGCHGAIIGSQDIWYTFEGHGTLEDCKIVLAFLGGNAFRNTCPISHKPLKQLVTFEAGYKAPVPDDNGSSKDPTYYPGRSMHNTGSNKKHRPRERQAAQRGAKKTEMIAYRNPEYVVSLIDDDNVVPCGRSTGKPVTQGQRKRTKSYYDDPDYVMKIDSSSSSSDCEIEPESIKITDSSQVQGMHSNTDSDATVEYNVHDYISAKKPSVVIKKLRTTVVHPVKLKSPKMRTVPAKTFHYGVKKPAHTFNCSTCGKKFYKYSALYHHKKFMHGCLYQCSICHMKLSSRGSLAEHTRRHNTETLRYLCELCGKKFLRPSLLKNHSTVHSDERNWKCDYSDCDAAYKNKSELTKHVKDKHSGSDSVKCSQCPMELESLKALKQHMQSHNPPNIPCRVCGKKFRHYSSRNLHEKKCVLPE